MRRKRQRELERKIDPGKSMTWGREYSIRRDSLVWTIRMYGIEAQVTVTITEILQGGREVACRRLLEARKLCRYSRSVK